ncbi:MAG TPA: MFS transporter [Chloroflexota bacterium]|nr:MFS transporter [Chloroflexota bacterium]
MQQVERVAAASPTTEPLATRAAPRVRLWSPTFALVCAVSFFSYIHWCVLGPIMPLWVQAHEGSAALVGLVAFSFSITSFILRPLIGRAVDGWSARGVLGLSTLVLGLAGLGYFVYHVALLLAVRAVHGVGWAGYNTGINTLLARVAPPARRGEAVGYMATAQGVALAVVPATALWLLGRIGFVGVFLLAAAAGGLATLCVVLMPNQPRVEAPPRPGRFWQGLIERAALLPSGLHFLSMLPQSPSVTFVPMYATFRGIAVETLPIYFLGYGLSSVTTRVFFGRWSDRAGRGWTLAVGATISAVGLLLLSQAADIAALTAGGVLVGFASAANSPAAMALAIDRSREERRGAAMATFSMAFQLADGGGALIFGLLIGAAGYQAMYYAAMLAPVATLLLLARNWRAANRAALARQV